MRSKQLCNALAIDTTTQIFTSPPVTVDGYPFAENITFAWSITNFGSVATHTISLQGRSSPDEAWATVQQFSTNTDSGVASVKNYPQMRLRIAMANSVANRTITAWVGR